MNGMQLDTLRARLMPEAGCITLQHYHKCKHPPHLGFNHFPPLPAAGEGLGVRGSLQLVPHRILNHLPLRHHLMIPKS